MAWHSLLWLGINCRSADNLPCQCIDNRVAHSPAPGVATADFVNSRQQYPWLIPLQNSFHAQSMKSLTRSVVGLRSCNVIWVSSAIYCSCYMQCLGWESVGTTTSPISVFKLGRVLGAVPTADAIATILVLIRLRSLPRFAETISQRYCSAATCEVGLTGKCRNT